MCSNLFENFLANLDLLFVFMLILFYKCTLNLPPGLLIFECFGKNIVETFETFMNLITCLTKFAHNYPYTYLYTDTYTGTYPYTDTNTDIYTNTITDKYTHMNRYIHR